VRFAADGMLGRLARWLRIAGHDTLCAQDLGVGPEGEDEALLRAAEEQGRILLTSDEALHARALRLGLRSVLVTGRSVLDQLLEISMALGRRLDMNFEDSRCPVCNGTLVQADPSEAPPEVRKDREFWKCSSCGKVYWEGKHWRSIIKTAERYKREAERIFAGRGKASGQNS